MHESYILVELREHVVAVLALVKKQLFQALGYIVDVFSLRILRGESSFSFHDQNGIGLYFLST